MRRWGVTLSPLCATCWRSPQTGDQGKARARIPQSLPYCSPPSAMCLSRRTERGDAVVSGTGQGRRRPCLSCERTPCDVHHLRFTQNPALSRKVSDKFTVPLCRGYHRELHRHGNEIGMVAQSRDRSNRGGARPVAANAPASSGPPNPTSEPASLAAATTSAT